MPMARASRDEWAERISQWRASGLSGREFAARVGVKESTLRYWKWMLAHERRRDAVHTTPAFVEIAGLVDGGRFEIIFGSGVRLLVPLSFEEATLRRLLEVLEGR